MEFSVAEVHEAIAATRARCGVPRLPRPAPDLGRRHRTNSAPRQPPHRCRPRRARRTVAARWARERTGSPGRSTSTTATSTSSPCSARSRPGWRRSTSTTATSPRSCATCSPTLEPRRSSCTASSHRPSPRCCPTSPDLRVILQVPDDSGNDLLARRGLVRGCAGGRVTREAGGGVEPRRPLHPVHRRYHRHAEGRAVAQRRRQRRVLRRVARPRRSTASSPTPTGGLKALLAPPFMHGAGHWMSFRTWNMGGTVYVQIAARPARPRRRVGSRRTRAPQLLAHRRRRVRPTAARRAERIDVRPVKPHRVAVGRRCAQRGLEGGVPRSPADADDRRRPRVVGGRRAAVARVGRQQRHDRHVPDQPGQPRAVCDDLDRELAPGDDEVGWLAKSGRLALGYLGDAAKTARTYPVVDGVRYAVPGDRARLRADGVIELHGRDSVDDQLRRREDLRRGGRGCDRRPTPPCTTASSPDVRASAGATRSSPSCGCAPVAPPTRRPADRGRAPHRPLQAAEGVRLRRRDRALTLRQGRLPLGHAGRRDIPERVFPSHPGGRTHSDGPQRDGNTRMGFGRIASNG